MRQIFDGFMDAHNYAQFESRSKKQYLTLCKTNVGGIKYSVLDEKEVVSEHETVFHKYNQLGEMVSKDFVIPKPISFSAMKVELPKKTEEMVIPEPLPMPKMEEKGEPIEPQKEVVVPVVKETKVEEPIPGNPKKTDKKKTEEGK